MNKTLQDAIVLTAVEREQSKAAIYGFFAHSERAIIGTVLDDLGLHTFDIYGQNMKRMIEQMQRVRRDRAFKQVDKKGRSKMEGPGFTADGVNVYQYCLSQGVVSVYVSLDKDTNVEEIEARLKSKANLLLKDVSFGGVVLDDHAYWTWEFKGRSVLWDVKSTLDEFAESARKIIGKKKS